MLTMIIPERFKLLRDIFPYGCAGISFYDYQRIYKKRLWNSYDLDVPAEIIINNPNMYWNYKWIAKTKCWRELEINPVLLNLLMDKYAYQLSFNPYVPFEFIIRHLDKKWNFKKLSTFNQTFQKIHIQKFNKFLNFYELSGNLAIPKDWIEEMPEYPWDLNQFRCRIELPIHQYLNQWTKEDYLNFDHLKPEDIYQSDLVDMEDFKELAIQEPEFFNIQVLSVNHLVQWNRNLKFTDVPEMLKYCHMCDLRRNKMDQPKLQQYFRCLYSSIIEEIKYWGN